MMHIHVHTWHRALSFAAGKSYCNSVLLAGILLFTYNTLTSGPITDQAQLIMG